MIDIIKNIFTFLGISLILNGLANYLKSDFIGPFLCNNIINILTTLLAINIATCSLIITKLKEISDTESSSNFTNTYNEIKKSLLEQVILIALAFVLSILNSSIVLKSFNYPHTFIFDSLLTAIFIYALYILWDTGKAIFLMVKSN